jgi:RNA polymerase-binding transcription factor DksA
MVGKEDTMSPASKAAAAKKAPAARPPATKKAVVTKKAAPTAKVTPAKKTTPAKTVATKKTAPPAKKATPPAKKAATTSTTTSKTPVQSKAAPAAKKTAPPAKKSAPPTKKAAPAAKAAPAKKVAAEKAPAKKAAPVEVAAPAPPRTTFTPKPKPPAPVRPKTGPYAKDPKFLEEIVELLAEERGIYAEQASSLRAEADSLALEREPGDVQFDEESGEGGTVTVDRERNLALSGQALLAVEEIDFASERVVDLTYGYCERCFQPIPKPRLRALPYARLCVACKSGGLSRR